MEKMRDFLRDHGMVCAVALCACAAVVTGVWAVRTIQKELDRTVPPTVEEPKNQVEQPPLQPELKWEESSEWDAGMGVAGKAEGIPEKQPSSGAQSSSESSSGESSSTGSGKEPSVSNEPAAVPNTLYAPPVSGSVVQAFSGDELVYNETLADWRTHNGVDYACATGSTVTAPTAGTVATVSNGGNWGGVLELTDADGRTWHLCGVEASVKAGDTVTCGQEVGKASGISCEAAVGSHVHLEVMKDGKYQNPAEIIR